ncbi:MAG: type II toxin-antitoxin system VapC family toxin [Devosia nanyangense]|uniref:Type II toxin-antitoxin system VapC family toxin n=1 Tax=Devosia nanyangense TaxID=1228055 RepID=A0A933L393_9HYPH|nr:type II toxin-antitoxin system VapC family toxin [Devosia nanyangense]
MILIDTNVLFDVVTDNAEWFEWSKARLDEAELAGELLINDIVFAEFSVRYASLEATERAVVDLGLIVEATPRAALFLAGKAFQKYRARKGSLKTGVLPDFLIGAHAACLDVPLLTRDPRRYRTYFPRLELIAP